MAIKKQKEEQRSLNKPKVKTLTKSPNNNSSLSFDYYLFLTVH